MKKSGIISQSPKAAARNEEEKIADGQNQADQEENSFNKDTKSLRGSMVNKSMERTVNAQRVGSFRGNQEYSQQDNNEDDDANNLSGFIRRGNNDLSRISMTNKDANN